MLILNKSFHVDHRSLLLYSSQFVFSPTDEVDSGKGKGQQNSRKRKAGEAADKNKMKHLRLDVSMPQTVTQIQSRMMEAEENRKQKISESSYLYIDGLIVVCVSQWFCFHISQTSEQAYLKLGRRLPWDATR